MSGRLIEKAEGLNIRWQPAQPYTSRAGLPDRMYELAQIGPARNFIRFVGGTSQTGQLA